MQTITLDMAQANFQQTFDRVREGGESVMIARADNQSAVVVMSLEEYNSLEETAFLLRNPANAKRLLTSVESLDQGHGQPRKLLD